MPNRENRAHGARWLARLLTIGKVIIGIAAAASLLWVIVTLPVWFESAPRLPLPVEVAISPDPDLITTGSDISPFQTSELIRVQGELEVEFRNAWAQWLYVFFAMQEFIIVFLILHFMSRIVGSIGRGEAFSAENAIRLRWVGGLMILESRFGPGASTLIAGAALRGVEFAGGTLSVDFFKEFGAGGLFTGWIVIVLSEVFRQGAAMKREQQLTI